MSETNEPSSPKKTTSRSYAPPRFVQLATGCCWVQIDRSEKDDDFRWVTLGLLSSHIANERAHFRGFNGRLRRAWKALAGEIDPTFEFITREELDATLDALERAGNEAFE